MTPSEQLDLSGHLEELRKRLIVVIISVAAFALLSFLFSGPLITLMTLPISKRVPYLYFFSPYEAFLVKLKIALAGGILLSLPVIFYQLWSFVSPGLYLKEKKLILPAVLISTVLFAFGALFAFVVVLPLALQFFLAFQTEKLVPLISIGSYISFFLSLVLIFGIVFDFPLVLIGLIHFKVIGTSFLVRQRKTMIVLIFILAAVLTPTVDIVTQCLLAVPLWLLYEGSIIVGQRIECRKGRSGV